MTEKVWDVGAWHAEIKRTKNGDERRLYMAMQRLTREIFAAALVRHHDPGEALMAVYMTGLYHATEVSNNPNK